MAPWKAGDRSDRGDKQKDSKKDRPLPKEPEDDRDDEGTSISKKVSWILRHGAKEANVNQDPETKWVKFSDMCQADILKGFSPDKIMQVVIDFNGKKLRYELDDTTGGPWIRAHKRDDTHKKERANFSASASTAEAGAALSLDRGAGLRVGAAEFTPVPAAGAAPAAPASAMQMQAQAQAAYAAQLQQANPYLGMMNPMMSSLMNPAYMWHQQQAAAAQAQAQAAAAAAAAASATVTPNKFQGRIKSFNADKGFGFIECQQTFQQYSRDVFLHKAQIGDMQPGAFVSFGCEVNKQGMPQAKDVQPLGPLPPHVQAQLVGPGKGGKGGGKGGGKEGRGFGGKGGAGRGGGGRGGGRGGGGGGPGAGGEEQ